MARPISDEELQLKRRARRRLIGAIVLVTAIVVALPMVLDTEPRPIGGEINIRIPPPDSSKFTSGVVPVPPSAERKSPPERASPVDAKSTPKFAAAVGEKPAPGTEPGQPEARPAPAVREPVPKQPAGEAPARIAVAPPASPAAGQFGQGEFAVQVVALADADKVKEVQAQIASAGLKSYTEVVKTSRGAVTRVRTGPYPTREQAEKARDQLQAAGLAGNVVPR